MASEAPEGWESVAALQEAYTWTLAALERANAVVEAAKAVRELWRYDAMAAAEPEIHTFVAAVDALSTQDGA